MKYGYMIRILHWMEKKTAVFLPEDHLRRRKYLKPSGWLLFEIGYDQARGSASELMKQAGFNDIIVKKDLAGLDRVVSGRYNKG
ncbi:MAG: hypothetical protein V8S14_06025 [Lachnospiraceae bacterium]